MQYAYFGGRATQYYIIVEKGDINKKSLSTAAIEYGLFICYY